MILRKTSSLFKIPNQIYFIFSRFIGLGSKALFIWILINKGYKDESYMISLYYIALSSSMILYNNEG